MNRMAGDWNCRSCQHLNFSRRDTCQRCGDTRIGGGGLYNGGSRQPGAADVKPGDWYCLCGVHNFASRSSCFKCGSFKEGTAAINGGGAQAFDYGSGLPGWKSGDWICTRYGCKEHNFASRMECFRCNAPREYIGI